MGPTGRCRRPSYAPGELAPQSVRPSLVENSTGSSNRVRLCTSHGLTTSRAVSPAATTTPTPATSGSRPAPAGESPSHQASGSTMNTSSRPSSARASMARPMAAPTHAAFAHVGASQNRYDQQDRERHRERGERLRHHQAVVHPEVGRDRGDPAPRSTRARSPATRRPISAISTTTPTPSTAMMNRCASVCSPPSSNRSATHDAGVERDGGEWRVLRGLRAVTRVGEPLPARQLVRLHVVEDLVAAARLVVLGQRDVPHAQCAARRARSAAGPSEPSATDRALVVHCWIRDNCCHQRSNESRIVSDQAAVDGRRPPTARPRRASRRAWWWPRTRARRAPCRSTGTRRCTSWANGSSLT